LGATLQKGERGSMNQFHKNRILIVDDEPSAIKLITRFLNDWDHYTADSTAKALASLKQNPVDIVISDIKMPGDDGLVLAKWINQLYPEIKVILMTGHADKELAIQAIKEGCFDFLEKPFKKEELLISLTKACSLGILQKKLNETEMKIQAWERMENIGRISPHLFDELDRWIEKLKQMIGERTTLERIGPWLDRFYLIRNSVKHFAELMKPRPWEEIEVSKCFENIKSRLDNETEGSKIIFDEKQQKHSIWGNIEPISEALFQLALNAIEASPEKTAKLSCQQDNNGDIIIEIINHGQTIDKNQVEKFFEPFSSDKADPSKVGLGLPIALNIFNKYGAIINMTSENRETTFRIIFKLDVRRKIHFDDHWDASRDSKKIA